MGAVKRWERNEERIIRKVDATRAGGSKSDAVQQFHALFPKLK